MCSSGASRTDYCFNNYSPVFYIVKINSHFTSKDTHMHRSVVLGWPGQLDSQHSLHHHNVLARGDLFACLPGVDFVLGDLALPGEFLLSPAHMIACLGNRQS